MFYVFVALVLMFIGLFVWSLTGRERLPGFYYNDYSYHYPRDTEGNYVARFFIGLVAGVLGFILFVAGLISSGSSEYAAHASRTELVSLGTGNSSEVHGYIGLLGGSISGEGFQTITYAKKHNGGVVLRQQDARKSVIYEDAPTGTGWMDTKTNITYQGDFIHFCFPWINPDDVRNETLSHYEFHVPAGSVVRQFEVAP